MAETGYDAGYARAQSGIGQATKAATRSGLGRAPRLGRDRRSKRKRNVNAMPGQSASHQAYARSASEFSSRMPLFAKIATAENSLRPAFASLFNPDANYPGDRDIERLKGKASRRNLRANWHLASISAIWTLASASLCRNLRHFWHLIRKAWERAASNRRNSRLSAKRCARDIERLAHRMRARIRRNALCSGA